MPRIRTVLLGNRTGSIELVYPVPCSSRTGNNDSIEERIALDFLSLIPARDGFVLGRARLRLCLRPWIDNPDGRHDSISVMAIAAS